MTQLTKDKTREIIEDFAQEISKRKSTGARPQKTVIDFRQELRNGTEREIYLVPIDLLRYRKDNGRISSNVYSYEKNTGILKEEEEETQKILGEFLLKKDPEETITLKKSITHSHQTDPAIITADGFLINGNRRKLVLEMLKKENPGNTEYETLKVVILPNNDDEGEGGPPTIKEIEQIENRYQLQSDGKAEYNSFDKALSIQRKINYGMSLEEQLHDDPNFVGLTGKQLKKIIDEYSDKYLEPLKCINHYLEQLGRTGLYDTVSFTDKEGRWQAFLDYYNSVYKKIKDARKRMELGVEENEIGKIQDVCFKIIRKKVFPGMKVHELMREMPKLLKNKRSKSEILKLVEINDKLPETENFDVDGNEYSFETIDKKWSKKNETKIMAHVNIARKYCQEQAEKETPLTLLTDALKKLNHDNLNPESFNETYIARAMKLLREISLKAHEIESKLYKIQKN